MIVTRFYVGVSDTRLDPDRQQQTLDMLSEIYGGATCIPVVGREKNGPIEDSLIFEVYSDGTAAETLARSVSGTLLDIYDDQDRVGFILAAVQGDTVERPHGNADPRDRERTVKARQEGGDR